MSSPERAHAASGIAAAADTPDELSGRVDDLARELERTVADGSSASLSAEALQRLVSAVCKAYAARLQAGAELPPFRAESPLSDTEVMIVASALLRAAHLQVFELGMWQSWTGR